MPPQLPIPLASIVRRSPGLLCLAVTLSWPCMLAGQENAPRLLVEVARDSGIDFEHEAGATGELRLPEITGSGVALFDADSDGDLDLYLVQGGQLRAEDGTWIDEKRRSSSDRLYRNETRDGVLRFVDASAVAGALSRGYGMGVAAGDYDNDGRVDLYVTNLGENRLLVNQGGGRFVERSASAGVDDPGWGVSASWVDLDRDGWLDLFVGNYAVWSAENRVRCYAKSSRPDYCGPLAFPPQADVFYRNRGDGTFERLFHPTLSAVAGAALGVVAADFDRDGWLEVLVANDGTANHLWRLPGGDLAAGLEEIGLFAGIAVNRAGRPEASMGVDLADYDGDGFEDLFLTHLDGETNTLLRGDGAGSFVDATSSSGLGPDGFAYTAFGTGSLDVDGDGLLDLFVANGAVRVDSLSGAAGREGLGQPNRVYRGLGDGRFEILERGIDPVVALPEVSRGAAFGDLDQDGDIDIVYSNNDGPARLLENRSGDDRWWGVDLRLGGRHALGARVGFVVAREGGERVVWRWVRTDGSYASSNDPRIAVSGSTLGGTPVALWIEVPGRERRVVAASRLKQGEYVVLEIGSKEQE